MLVRARRSVGRLIMLIFEIIGMLGGLTGAIIAMVRGKYFAAVILGALALGLFFRINGRGQEKNHAAVVVSPWVILSCVLLSLIEVSILAEATNLPVRFNQPGFEIQNWSYVILALLILYFLQLRFFLVVLKKRQAK